MLFMKYLVLLAIAIVVGVTSFALVHEITGNEFLAYVVDFAFAYAVGYKGTQIILESENRW